MVDSFHLVGLRIRVIHQIDWSAQIIQTIRTFTLNFMSFLTKTWTPSLANVFFAGKELTTLPVHPNL
jgi:hypothetical protein